MQIDERPKKKKKKEYKMDSAPSNKINRKTDNYNNLDHLYCNTNDTNNHIRATNNTGGNNTTDNMGTIRKEITQLKAMLLLHLDLIQEQSDQLMSKDKLLTNLRQENEMLKMKIERMDRRSKLNNNNKKQNQQNDDTTTTTSTSSSSSSTTKSTMTTTNSSSVASLAEIRDNSCELPEIKTKCDIDILKKISTKFLNNCTLKLNSLSELVEDQKFSICNIDDIVDAKIVQNFNQITANSTPSVDATTKKPDELQQPQQKSTHLNPLIKTFAIVSSDVISSNQFKPIELSNNSIIGESNGKLISKIILQRVQNSGGGVENDHQQQGTTTIVIKNENEPKVLKELLPAKSSDVNLENENPFKSDNKDQHQEKLSIVDIDDTIISEISLQPDSSPPTAINMPVQTLSSQAPNSDDFINEQGSLSPASVNNHHDDVRKRTHTVSMSSSIANTDNNVDSQYLESPSSVKRHHFTRSHKLITTKDRYRTREWCMDEMADEVNRQIAETGEDRPVQENVNLEIPRWVIKECPGLYSIEGTEDLSDEIFLKRHTRLEQHERKRKKWDVQRIREQRTIERLKRRHCKEELFEQKDFDYTTSSFYPLASNVKYLQYTDELPVAAFGEIIPMIHKVDFTLPWLQRSISQHQSTATSTSLATINYNSYQHYHHNNQQNSDQKIDHTSIVFVAKKKINRRHFLSSGTLTASITNQTSPIKSRAVIRRRARR